MSKKIIQFTKLRYYMLTLSLLLIVGGIAGIVALGGFNLGIDFQAGLSQRVQIANEALSITYTGSNDASLDIAGGDVVITIRGSEGVQTENFPQNQYPTISDLAEGINRVDGLQANVVGDPNRSAADIVTGLSLPYELSEDAVTLATANSATTDYVTIDEVRNVLRDVDGVQVQVVGDAYEQEFQIRVPATTEGSKDELENEIRSTLRSAYGDSSVIVKGSNYVGPKFSAALSTSALFLVIAALVLIMFYIWFRFKFAYAVSALSALVHDILIMLGFIAVAQLEVSTTTIAAVLTIIGYSLNDTIVVFDRIRENNQIMKGVSHEHVINKSITQSLSRTVMTSVTTLFAVIPLYVFATGAIKLFALNLIVGIIVGTYSSIFVASPVLLALLKRQQRRQATHLGKTTVEKQEATELSEDTSEQTKQPAPEVEIPQAERKLKRGKRKKKK